MKVANLDHFVLTVAEMDRTCDFYVNVLGMEVKTFKEGRIALHFGHQKINLHQLGHEFEPKAQVPTPGSADLCFVTETALSDVLEHFQRCGVEVEEGPVTRTGAEGAIQSVYVRDPDGNLIEVSNYMDSTDR